MAAEIFSRLKTVENSIAICAELRYFKYLMDVFMTNGYSEGPAVATTPPLRQILLFVTPKQRKPAMWNNTIRTILKSVGIVCYWRLPMYLPQPPSLHSLRQPQGKSFMSATPSGSRSI